MHPSPGQDLEDCTTGDRTDSGCFLIQDEPENVRAVRMQIEKRLPFYATTFNNFTALCANAVPIATPAETVTANAVRPIAHHSHPSPAGVAQIIQIRIQRQRVAAGSVDSSPVSATFWPRSDKLCVVNMMSSSSHSKKLGFTLVFVKTKKSSQRFLGSLRPAGESGWLFSRGFTNTIMRPVLNLRPREDTC